MADIRNIHIDQGADYTHVFTYLDPESKEPVDMDAWTGVCQIRDTEDGSLLWEGTTETGGLTLDADGVITLFVPGAESSSWGYFLEKAVYQIELTTPLAKSERAVQGTVFIDQEVIR